MELILARVQSIKCDPVSSRSKLEIRVRLFEALQSRVWSRVVGRLGACLPMG